MRLNNKNIVVTAAAQGIGRATAIAYSKEGANVVATDINEEKLNELKAENSNIKTEVLDSTNKEAVENFSQSIKDVDVLFHAVGFVHLYHNQRKNFCSFRNCQRSWEFRDYFKNNGWCWCY